MEVNSENIHIPELREFMGKRVEMIIVEVPLTLPGEKKDGKMARFSEAAGRIEIDEEVGKFDFSDLAGKLTWQGNAISTQRSLRYEW